MNSSDDEIIENDDNEYGEFSEDYSYNNEKIQNQTKNEANINTDIIKQNQNTKENINKYNEDDLYFYNENKFPNSSNAAELEQKIQKEFLKQKIEEMGRNSRSKKNYENLNYEEGKDNYKEKKDPIKEKNKEAGEDFENKNTLKYKNESEEYRKLEEQEEENIKTSNIISDRLQIEKSIAFDEIINSKNNDYVSYKTDNVELFGNKKSKNNINNKNQNNRNKITNLNLASNATDIYKNYMNINNSTKLNSKYFEINNIISENFSSRQLNNSQNEHIKNKLDFNDLLKNKTFKKFLKNKIKNSKIDNQIPKNFIDALIDEKTVNINDDQKNNIDNIYNNTTYYNKNDNNIIENKTILSRTVENKNKCFNINKNYIESFKNKDNFESNNNNVKYKFEKEKNNLLLENKKLMNKITSLQNEIQNSKNELYDRDGKLKNYLNIYDKIKKENKINIEKIDELKKELNAQKNEMQSKINKINELENINLNLTTNLSNLQKNYDLETSCNKETKQNYEEIKSNYINIKNQYDLLNLKYKNLSDENFNFLRDKTLYEKQLKSKNKIIDNFLESNSAFKKFHMRSEFNVLKSKDNNYLDFLEEERENIENENIKIRESNGMEKEKKESEQKENVKSENDEKFMKMTFPELQSKRDELIQERKEVSNVYSKIPSNTTRKEQINKREQLENRLKEIGSDLAKIKLRLINYNN